MSPGGKTAEPPLYAIRAESVPRPPSRIEIGRRKAHLRVNKGKKELLAAGDKNCLEADFVSNCDGFLIFMISGGREIWQLESGKVRIVAAGRLEFADGDT